MNQFMMGMLAIAATAFVSCSNEDATNDNTSRQNVENFYMNLKVVGNTSNGTRTTGTPTEDGSDAESKITSGTIWLVDGSGKVAFSKYISGDEWNSSDLTVMNPIKVAVTQVEENTPYKVYFLANKEGTLGEDPTTQVFTSEKGGIDYATDNAFVMFNQNDKAVKADQYTVTFTDDNKDATNPAKPENAIKLDRLTARIDVPTTVTTITKDPIKTDLTENIEAITGLTFDGFATSNLANESYMQQNWTADWNLNLPGNPTYYWDKNSYGTTLKADQLENFQKDKVQYLFEQTTDNVDKATSIYLQYTAVASTDSKKDFTDGTFYRYDKHVFTSIQDIIKHAGAANPFGTKTAEQVVAEIKDTDKSTETETVCTEEQDILESFRDNYKIEVFVAGKVYYRYAIEDPDHANYSILRNSIYRIAINNIYDLGTDTPNGDKQVKPVYYLYVEVKVNPWVLKTIGIDLE